MNMYLFRIYRHWYHQQTIIIQHDEKIYLTLISSVEGKCMKINFLGFIHTKFFFEQLNAIITNYSNEKEPNAYWYFQFYSLTNIFFSIFFSDNKQWEILQKVVFIKLLQAVCQHNYELARKGFVSLSVLNATKSMVDFTHPMTS